MSLWRILGKAQLPVAREKRVEIKQGEIEGSEKSRKPSQKQH